MIGKTNIWILVVKIFNTTGKIPCTQEGSGSWSSSDLVQYCVACNQNDKVWAIHCLPPDKGRSFHLTALSLSSRTVYHIPSIVSREGKGAIPLPPTLCLLLSVKVFNTFSLHIVSFMKLYLAVCFLEDMTALEANY